MRLAQIVYVAVWTASVAGTAIPNPVSRNTRLADSGLASDSNLGLRTLILGSTDENVIVPKNILSAYGSPYDVYIGTQPSYAENSWHSIVIADSDVDPAEVRQYAVRTRARIAILQPLKDDLGDLGVVQSNVNGFPNVTVATGVPASISGVLNNQESWSITELSPLAVIIVDNEAVQPFLKYNVVGSNDFLAAFVSKNKVTGTEEMHFMFNAIANELTRDFDINYSVETESTHINLALGHAWMEWVTRGVFIGYRRMTLNLHIDDWYHKAVPLDAPNAAAQRIQGVDVENYATWRKSLHTKLPVGSDFKLEPAFNGAGIAMLGFEDTEGLLEATQKNAAEFFWVSHTWTHVNMDWVDSAKTTHPDAVRYDAEFDYNKRVVRGEGIATEEYIDAWAGYPATPSGQFLNNDPILMKNNFSPHSLVTPEISGLWPKDFNGKVADGRKAYPKNELFWDRLIANGMYNVVGDTSRLETVAEYKYHGIFTTIDQYGTSWGMIMPRFGPNVPWNCYTESCLEYHYNDEGACGWIAYGPTCPGKMSGSDIIIREAKTATIPLLQLRWDSYMFHQANMFSQPYKSGQVGLVSQFAEEALLDVMRFVDGLPFVSLKMDDLGDLYRERMTRDYCDIQGSITFATDGTPSSIEVQGKNGPCQAAVTITSRSGLSFDGEAVTVYGPDKTSFQDATTIKAAKFKVAGSFF
ncbi:hypothetical protein SARC_08911 [Sphaeroforma arctica JP610]|uniref:Agd3 deacetylase domain-containing protein n=1 Tax=Sphaeroforma arctica JP610 TaxID=667725 RepID=A0A0L0FRS6_9EUKA|nr:hypothetical protein SARC_08911 [Sphaeroforma arctica JP610]KNC78663.1 hypothetical protein SARC_08911 [Sphaeroforma arctica JP610]|eukprot:XP_014152565.1 hypothetical protein SARC_08911 [Sphaeroforma arctica JP610]